MIHLSLKARFAEETRNLIAAIRNKHSYRKPNPRVHRGYITRIHICDRSSYIIIGALTQENTCDWRLSESRRFSDGWRRVEHEDEAQREVGVSMGCRGAVRYGVGRDGAELRWRRRGGRPRAINITKYAGNPHIHTYMYACARAHILKHFVNTSTHHACIHTRERAHTNCKYNLTCTRSRRLGAYIHIHVHECCAYSYLRVTINCKRDTCAYYLCTTIYTYAHSMDTVISRL